MPLILSTCFHLSKKIAYEMFSLQNRTLFDLLGCSTLNPRSISEMCWNFLKRWEEFEGNLFWLKNFESEAMGGEATTGNFKISNEKLDLVINCWKELFNNNNNNLVKKDFDLRWLLKEVQGLPAVKTYSLCFRNVPKF